MCTEDSPSGLWRTLGKRVGCKPSGVRIPHPPPPDPGTASGSGVFVACGAAGVPGAVGPGRPRDRHTRASLGVVDLEARPCPPVPPAPSTPVGLVVCWVAWRVVSKPGQALPPLSNFARNSPVTLSNIEFGSLELQRFQTMLKIRSIELRAKFLGGVSVVTCGHRRAGLFGVRSVFSHVIPM